MLEVTFRRTEQGVYIQAGHNADRFNAFQLKAKTKMDHALSQEMLLAGDSVIVAHSAEEIQVLVDRFKSAARSFSLTINIKETECLYQPTKQEVPLLMLSDIRINNESLVQCKNPFCVGTTLSDSAKLDKELMYGMGEVSAAVGRLQERLWNNHHLSVKGSEGQGIQSSCHVSPTVWIRGLDNTSVPNKEAACFYYEASETNNYSSIAIEDNQPYGSKESWTAIYGRYNDLKRYEMDWVRPPNETLAHADTARLLAIGDWAVKSP